MRQLYSGECTSEYQNRKINSLACGDIWPLDLFDMVSVTVMSLNFFNVNSGSRNSILLERIREWYLAKTSSRFKQVWSHYCLARGTVHTVLHIYATSNIIDSHLFDNEKIQFTVQASSETLFNKTSSWKRYNLIKNSTYVQIIYDHYDHSSTQTDTSPGWLSQF